MPGDQSMAELRGVRTWMLRMVVRTYGVIRALRNRLRLLRRRPMAVVPSDVLFPDVPTVTLVEQELGRDFARGFLLHPGVPSVRRLAGKYRARISYLPDVLFCSRRNVVMTADLSAVVENSVGYPDVYNPHVWPPERGEIDLSNVVDVDLAAGFRCYQHFRIHYHVLIDGAARLFALAECTDPGRRVELILAEPVLPWEKYLLDRLLPEHIVPRVVPLGTIVRARTFVLSDFVAPQDVALLPQAYLGWFLGRVCPKRPRNRRHRVLVTRRDVPTRRITNEPELIDRLERMGFSAVELAHLSVEQQIELFYDAEIVVSAHGSGLANIVFSEGILVVEIFNSPLMRMHYMALSRCLGHRYRGIYGRQLRKDDDFEVDVAQLVEVLQSAGA